MTPVLFSVSYAGYWGQHTLSIEDFIRKAAALGFPAVELAGKRPHLSVLDYATEESVAAIPTRRVPLGSRSLRSPAIQISPRAASRAKFRSTRSR